MLFYVIFMAYVCVFLRQMTSAGDGHGRREEEAGDGGHGGCD